MRKELLLSIFVAVAGCASNPPAPLAADAPNCADEMIPTETVAPRYPAEALMAGETGAVEIGFDVGPGGAVLNAEVRSATSGRTFNTAALRSIEQWRFPAPTGGCRNGTYTIYFEIDDSSTWPPKAL